MFDGDGYFVQLTDGNFALSALSGSLVFAMIASVRVARRKVSMLAAAPAAGFVFWWLFVWLSSQAYYLLYMQLTRRCRSGWSSAGPRISSGWASFFCSGAEARPPIWRWERSAGP